MLCDLHINDFVIARSLHMELAQGLTVLTGETGAGKSILVGALGLVLGDRADSQSVRSGAEKAEISAVFDVSRNSAATAWLDQNDLASDGDCIVRRLIQSSGRSRAFVNGKPVPVQQLKELGQLLVDIHGQHEHQAMVRPAVQRQLLDDFGHHEKPLALVRDSFGHWQECKQKHEALIDALAERSARLDLLRFQTDELEKLQLTADEFDTLSEEQYRLSHVGTLAESGLAATSALNDENSGVQSGLAKAQRALESIVTIDESLREYFDLLESARIQVDEAVSGLGLYIDKLDMDPARRDFVEQRLDNISGLAKKHRISPENLLAHFETLNTELARLENAEESIAELQESVDAAAQAYKKEAAKLTRARKKAAKGMAGQITSLVKELGMPESEFSIGVTSDDNRQWSPVGCDNVQFMIQANPGEPARPVSKVASGGELSRISLAVQVVSAATESIPCMVFDEIDAGVGGAVADMIGRHLQELAVSRQILSVTHLPQVACHGNQHFKVSKTALNSRTHSQVQLLSAKDRIEELARMLGGAKLTATTRKHAEELLTQAQKFRQTA